MKAKIYHNAPLPFQGQKRNMLKHYQEALKQFDDDCVFVDLFGGSGLLSHVAKREKPKSTVIYNDFDNYRERLDNIENTNKLISEFRDIIGEINRKQSIPKVKKCAIIEKIREAEKNGFVDYLTISANILFSGKNAKSLGELMKNGFYNRVVKTKYDCEGYLDGLTITSCDYKELFNCYKDIPNAVFILDPPYLSTDVKSYNCGHWKLKDYLDILPLLKNQKFIYFTSQKTGIIELINCLKNAGLDIFSETKQIRVKSWVNYNSTYEDILIYRH